jgi:hypothetical protein
MFFGYVGVRFAMGAGGGTAHFGKLRTSLARQAAQVRDDRACGQFD